MLLVVVDGSVVVVGVVVLVVVGVVLSGVVLVKVRETVENLEAPVLRK